MVFLTIGLTVPVLPVVPIHPLEGLLLFPLVPIYTRGLNSLLLKLFNGSISCLQRFIGFLQSTGTFMRSIPSSLRSLGARVHTLITTIPSHISNGLQTTGTLIQSGFQTVGIQISRGFKWLKYGAIGVLLLGAGGIWCLRKRWEKYRSERDIVGAEEVVVPQVDEIEVDSQEENDMEQQLRHEPELSEASHAVPTVFVSEPETAEVQDENEGAGHASVCAIPAELEGSTPATPAATTPAIQNTPVIPNINVSQTEGGDLSLESNGPVNFNVGPFKRMDIIIRGRQN